jgi:hypothetical protein
VESAGAPAVCWPRSSSVRQINVTFHNPTSIDHIANLSVSSGTFANVLNERWAITISASPASLHFSPQGNASTTLTISGLPDSVQLASINVPFALQSNVTSLAGALGTRIYLTDSAPAVMQSPAWVDVLNDACYWACDCSGTDTVTRYITLGLYWSDIFIYDYSKNNYAYHVNPATQTEQEYMLYKLFYNRAHFGQFRPGDCQDISTYLQIALNANGVGSSCQSLWLPDGSGGLFPFETNPICGQGNDATNPGNYAEFGFNFHQVTFEGGNVFDAAIAQWLDLFGNGYANPPVGWGANGYWQSARPSPPIGETAYLGLVNRPAGFPGPVGQPVAAPILQTILFDGYLSGTGPSQ